MRRRENQDLCCEAVVRLLERQLGSQRSMIVRPDEIVRDREQVDLIVTIGTKRVAIEHTEVEPTELFKASAASFDRLFKGFEDCVAGQVPANYSFDLVVPLDAGSAVPKKDVMAVRARLEVFAVGAMAKLHALHSVPPAPPPVPTLSGHAPGAQPDVLSHFTEILAERARWREANQPPAFIDAEAPDLPFQARLRVYTGRVPPVWLGKLRVVRAYGDDLEAKRAERIRRAIQGKTARLAEASANGCDTVLVLESEDFVLSNDGLIFNALTTAASAGSMPCDKVFCANSGLSTLIVSQLVDGGKLRQDWHQEWHEFAKGELVAQEAR